MEKTFNDLKSGDIIYTFPTRSGKIEKHIISYINKDENYIYFRCKDELAQILIYRSSLHNSQCDDVFASVSAIMKYINDLNPRLTKVLTYDF